VPRKLRDIQAGEIYHVISRGNGGRKTFRARDDFLYFLALLERVAERYEWTVLAYCLMSNHYHLVVRAGERGLSDGMRDLNGIFSRWSNKRYGRSGHLWLNRFFCKHVASGGQALLTCRYVVLNPVRARMCRLPEEYVWSSYRACADLVRPAPFLRVDELLAFFGNNTAAARRAYVAFVAEGVAEIEAATSG
jgi:putative transposase